MHKKTRHDKHHNKHTLWIVIAVCVTLIIIFALYRFTGNSNSNSNTLSNNPSNSLSEKSKIQDCPYECCEAGDYEIKSCQEGYFCSNNMCEAKDSDNDGLTDIEEKPLGTNPQLYDSDGDTLSDYQEVKVLYTNPLNPNTDSDRYNDNLDSEPTTKNTADIIVNVGNKEFNIQWITLGIAIIGGGVVVPSMVIAEPSVTIIINNQGTAYSSYLGYDVVVYVSGEELKRVHQTAGKIDKNYNNNPILNFEIKAGDVPSILINSISNKNTQWDVIVENIDYEKF